MRQNFDALKRKFPGFYRHDYLRRKREALGWSERETARRANVNYGTIQKVFAGKATQKKVFPVAVVLDADWRALHDLVSPVEKLDQAVRA